MSQAVLDAAGIDVSRETLARLETYAALLQKWNAAINLVAKSTLDELWQRHIVDSAQLARFFPQGQAVWADLGSGGGLPGLILAIMALETAPGLRFHLVESDQRKATFLRQVARELALPVTVSAARIESLPPMAAQVISARALAPLPMLCGFAAQHLCPDGIAIFPKGSNAADEIAAARKLWSFDLEIFPSLTSTDAAILQMKMIRHV